MPSHNKKLGLIAGNGKFPFLVLDAARAQGYDVVVAAIKEEASPEIEDRGAASVHWLSLGELSKLIETFQREGVRRAIMAGQVKHKQIFSAIRPDWRMAKLLLVTRHAQHRQPARRRGQGTRRGRHHAGEFHRAARTVAGESQACSRAAGLPSRNARTSTTAAPWPASWRSMTLARRS